MTKLLYITNGIIGAGGLERVLSIKASYLANKMDYEVHILTLNQNEVDPFYEFSPKIVLHDVTANGNPVRYFLRYYNGIKKVIKKIKPDIISVCDDGLKGFFLPSLLRKPCPMIYERHASVNLNFKREKSNLFLNLKNKIVHRVMNWRAKTFSAFVVLTNGNLKEWHAGNEVVIPNPISFFSSEVSSLSNKKVIAVGSHSYNKGYDLLLSAWKQVISIRPDWNLEIFGKFDSNHTFIQMAQDLNLSKSVIFHEPVHNINDKYLEASIMALPSRSEGFGMVLIEAMACGVPCVSFDCPHGPADIITDGEDGFLAENSNVALLTSKMMRLMEDEKLRKQMGNKAKQNVRKYLPENIIPQWDELFNTLLKANNA